MQELIRSDGGKGEFQELTPPVLGIFDTLLKVRHPCKAGNAHACNPQACYPRWSEHEALFLWMSQGTADATWIFRVSLAFGDPTELKFRNHNS